MTDILDENSIFWAGREQTLTGDEAIQWADYLEAEAAGANVQPEEAAAWRSSATTLRELAEQGRDLTLEDLLPILDSYQGNI